MAREMRAPSLQVAQACSELFSVNLKGLIFCPFTLSPINLL